MNKDKLIDLCHKISEKTGLTFNSILIYYFLESILHRLSSSSYKENFIFKGGLLLSNIVGIDSRSTVDIDLLLDNIEFSKDKILKILSEALTNDNSTEISYEIEKIQTIKQADRYGGFRVSILCRLQNIRQVVPLDIATGDSITPHPIDYRYISIFGVEDIKIRAYPIETIVAEKLETIYMRGFLNSRSKDYYDLYILYQLRHKEIDKNTLIRACKETFLHRKTEFTPLKIKELLIGLKEDDTFLKRWKTYTKKNIYAKEITFDDAINNALKLIEFIDI